MIVRPLPNQMGNLHHLSQAVCGQMAAMARAAFIEEHGEEPLLIQNIERSAWWRAGPVEEK